MPPISRSASAIAKWLVARSLANANDFGSGGGMLAPLPRQKRIIELAVRRRRQRIDQFYHARHHEGRQLAGDGFQDVMNSRGGTVQGHGDGVNLLSGQRVG